MDRDAFLVRGPEFKPLDGRQETLAGRRSESEVDPVRANPDRGAEADTANIRRVAAKKKASPGTRVAGCSLDRGSCQRLDSLFAHILQLCMQAYRLLRVSAPRQPGTGSVDDPGRRIT
jgi:hypothetical protein